MGSTKNTDSNISVQQLIKDKKGKKSSLMFVEKLIPKLLLLCAILSVFTTVGIVYTLLSETFTFFEEVSLQEFFAGEKWSPWTNHFYILPLLSGTLLVTAVAMIVAVPFGLGSAIFLSEYASSKVRKTIKPILEVLAGIPTVVYGYFALTFVTPLLQNVIPDLSIFNALSAGIVVGVMIIPMVASLSEDAMSSVPSSLREGAFGLGATRFEVATKVVLPAAFSGIVASVVLAISRAIGETMIVSLAAGSTPKLTADVTQSIQTMTGFMVQAATGDAGYGTPIYYSLYAVGMTLFIFTLIMNLIAQYISRKFREEY